VLRHVLHHTPNTEAVLREALRVGRYGVLIAEPWADLSVPSQHLAKEIDHWSKSVHQALGYYHRPGLTVTEVLAGLPERPPVHLRVDYFANLEPISAESIFKQMSEFIARLPKLHSLRDQEKKLKQQTCENQVSAMGSMLLTAEIDSHSP
jgi:ubiquinone/menaquinone biosynthesis C-methylase UbiE